jgi:hypothetical protein
MNKKRVFTNGVLKSLAEAEALSGRKGSDLYYNCIKYDRRIISAHTEYNGVEHVFVVKFQTNGHNKLRSYPYHKFIKACEIVRRYTFN